MANPAFSNSIFNDERTHAAADRSGYGASGYGSQDYNQGYGQYGQGQYNQYGQGAYGQRVDYADPNTQVDPRFAEVERSYNAPSATAMDTGRLTYDDVIVKTGLVLAVVVGFAIAGAALVSRIPGLILIGAIGGLILGFVNIAKMRNPNPALVFAYAALEGLFLGGLSAVVEAQYSGVVIQALIGTMAVFVGALVAYSKLGVRITSKVARFTMIAMIGLLVFSLINMVLMLSGANQSEWGLRTSVTIMGIPLGVFMGVLAIFLGAISLISDFQMIDTGVRAGVPAKFAWYCAFALTVTIIWLYVELLRLLAILQRN